MSIKKYSLSSNFKHVMFEFGGELIVYLLIAALGGIGLACIYVSIGAVFLVLPYFALLYILFNKIM